MKIEIPQNNNAECDFNIPAYVKINLSKIGNRHKMELTTIAILQDILDKSWELKNATNSLDSKSVLVEHKQRINPTDIEYVPSGLMLTKTGFYFFGWDDVGGLFLKTEFLKWILSKIEDKTYQCYNGPLKNQTLFQGFAYIFPFEDLPYLIKLYRKELHNKENK